MLEQGPVSLGDSETSTLLTLSNRSATLRAISQARLAGNRAEAQALFFDWVIPNSAFSHKEVESLSYRLGAIDMGDQYVAARTDL